MKDLLIALFFTFFSSKNGHYCNINGACKAIDVDTRCEVVIKNGKQMLIIGLSLFPKSQLQTIFSSKN